MENLKHTKGEWAIYLDETGTPFISNPSEYGRICTIRKQEKNFNANAKLIAAAPGLLEALIEANKIIQIFEEKEKDSFADNVNIDSHIKIINAIKKATE
jgi:hypothetical protein